MQDARLGWRALIWLLILAGLSVGLGLGSATHLTYHEAFVAQGAREIVRAGAWLNPMIGGLPWLEKPPLPFWLAASLGWCAGDVTPTAARLPFALSAVLLVLGVWRLATRHYGAAIGVLAGAVQVTTAWTVLRGRLAEAEILLACLITWALVAFDQIRSEGSTPDPATTREPETNPQPGRADWHRWRWAFFVLLGVMSLVKGTGFGAALVLATVLGVVVWDGDRRAWNRLAFPAGWIVAAVLALGWPLAVIFAHGPRVMGLWLMHVAQRVQSGDGHGPFAGESWVEYGFGILGQNLPWTPLVALGAWCSLGCLMRGGRARGKGAGDRLLWCWALIPLALVSLARARNAHYAIYAQVPWSIWGALGLARVGEMAVARGRPPLLVRRRAIVALTAMSAAYGLGFWLLGTRLENRGAECRFYESAGRLTPPGERLVLLYDDWDREPYPTPFGPIPHDAAVRLYYLNRPACWHHRANAWQPAGQDAGSCPWHTSGEPYTLLGRPRDLSSLESLAQVETLAVGPTTRWDRSYILARVTPGATSPLAEAPEAARQSREETSALR